MGYLHPVTHFYELPKDHRSLWNEGRRVKITSICYFSNFFCMFLSSHASAFPLRPNQTNSQAQFASRLKTSTYTDRSAYMYIIINSCGLGIDMLKSVSCVLKKIFSISIKD